MQKIRLSDVCSPKQWKTIPTSELLEEGYPVYGANGVIGYYSDYNHAEPVVTITCRGATCGSVNRTVSKSYVTGNAMCLDNVRKDIDIEYLYYCLLQYDFNDVISGSAQPQITRQGLEKVFISVVPYTEQIEIVKKLKCAEKIIELRKKELNYLDELVKARFVEMFGDYDLSHVRTDWKTISEIGKVVGGATPKTNVEEYWDGEYRWITPAELSADSGYIYNSVRKLTKAGVESCSLQEMPIDTVILSSRAPIGKVAIAGTTFYCNQGFKNIICNEEILPRYLYTVLLLNTEYLNSLGRGATFKEISKSIVESIKIPVPSIELQKNFTIFVEQVDKSKVAVQKALDEAQTLFDSLMQQYFG